MYYWDINWHFKNGFETYSMCNVPYLCMFPWHDGRRIGLEVGGFLSWQHLESYQDGDRFVTVHGDFMVLHHWEIWLTWYPTQSHYSEDEPTIICHILIMLSDWQRSNKCKYLNHWFDSTGVWTLWLRNPHSTKIGDGSIPYSAIPSVSMNTETLQLLENPHSAMFSCCVHLF